LPLTEREARLGEYRVEGENVFDGEVAWVTVSSKEIARAIALALALAREGG